MSSPSASTSWRVWRWPTAIGVASAIGLVSALVGDGVWDLLSWIALGVPVAVCAVAWKRSRERAAGADPAD